MERQACAGCPFGKVIVELTGDDRESLTEIIGEMQAGSLSGLLALLAHEWREQNAVSRTVSDLEKTYRNVRLGVPPQEHDLRSAITR